MGKNSSDDSLGRYEELIKISVRYNDYLERPRIRGLSSRSKKRANDAALYVYNVKKAISSLNEEEREIIQREFFYNNGDPMWWSKYYSRSTYYRKRSLAVKSFMENYEQ